MVDEKSKSRLIEMVTRSQAGLDRLMPTFNKLFNAYQALLDEGAVKYLDEKGKSRIPFYMIMTKLQRINADFVEAYFTNKQFAKLNERKSLKGSFYDPQSDKFIPFSRGIYDGMNKKSIEALQNAIDYYTGDDNDNCLYSPLTKAFKQLQIYGTGVLKVYWNEDVRLEKVDLKDIKFDTEAVSFEECKYLVHDIYVTKNEILEFRDAGMFESDADYEKINDNNGTNTDNPNPTEFKRFKLQEIYEKKGKEWLVSTIWNKEVILRHQVSLPDGNPFVVGTIKEQEVKPDGTDSSIRVYGDSIAAPLIPIQQEMIIIRNQQLDIIDRQLNPRYIINDKSINPFDFTNQKISVIRGDGNQVKEMTTPNMRDSNFGVDRLGVEAQEAIGVTDYGGTGAKQMNKTATGMSILTSESNKILQHLLRGANETMIKPLFNKIANLVWRYGDAELFYGIDRTQVLDFQIGVDVGMGSVNKETALNSKTMAYSKMVEMAQMKMQMSGDSSGIIKAEKFLYQEIFPLLGVENFEEYEENEQPNQAGGIENPNPNEYMENNAGGIEGGQGLPTEPNIANEYVGMQ